MEQTVNQRIILLQKIAKEKGEVFSKVIGVAQSTLSTIKTRNSNPSFSVILAILKAYPNLNVSWLILGEGEMWKDGDASDGTPLPGRAMDIEIERLKLRVEKLEEKLDKLK